MSNLRCSGNEESIHLCPKIENPGGCSHSEDVGIVCSNGIFIYNLVTITYMIIRYLAFGEKE